MVFKRTARMSAGGKVPCHQLAPRGACCSTPTLTITLTVPCTSAAQREDPSSGSDGDSDISNNLGSGINGGNNHDGGSNNSSNDLHRGPRGTPHTQPMTVATTEVVIQPIVVNQTKDAPLDISLNHERLLEEPCGWTTCWPAVRILSRRTRRRRLQEPASFTLIVEALSTSSSMRVMMLTPRPRFLPYFS
jgi:hypothetical protein